MASLSEFLTNLRQSGSLSLLAGHYAWPGRPDSFAIDSALHITQALDELEHPSVNGYIFINDIAGMSMDCAPQCDLGPTQPQRSNGKVGELRPWVANLLPEIEKAAINQESSWFEEAASLAQLLTDLNQAEDSTSMVAYPLAPNQYASKEKWLADVEEFLYLTLKPAFRPLLLSRQTGRRLPPVLFERTITNGASRMLHKLQKTKLGTNLHFDVDADGRRSYWVQDLRGNRIDLRRETVNGLGMRASNKCAAILAQLFFYGCRSLKRAHANLPSRSVFYVIPSYDRDRLRDGITAFFEMYQDLEQWVGAEKITLAYAFYTCPDRREMCCEVYSRGPGSTYPSVSTHRISTPASDRVHVRLGQDRYHREFKRVYVDHNATTPIDPRVLEKMMPYMTEAYGNASSGHLFGWEAELAIAEARQHVANLIGADPDEIFFTSGATESNNWFLKQWAHRDSVKIISSALEHKAVLEPLEYVSRNNLTVTYLPFDRAGLIDLDAIKSQTLSRNTIISLMSVNNEIHTLLDLEAVGTLTDRLGVIFHTDAAQAVGRIPINVRRMNIHAMSMSGHKIYGPKGVGALFVTKALQKRLSPLVSGGGQERGHRSGTLATHLIVGFGQACAIATSQMDSDAQKLYELSEIFLSRLASLGVTYRLIGPSEIQRRQPGALSFMIAGLEARKLSELLPEIALSRGSACNSLESGNHVLKALGLRLSEENSVIRLSFGRYNKLPEALYVADRIAEVLTISKPYSETVISDG